MTKVKSLVILFVIALLILVFPNIANAAKEYTYSDTEQGIEWVYELDENENIIDLRCTTKTKTGAVTIPSTIEEKTVISLSGGLSKGAFQDCAGITSVTIPNTITLIGGYAFENCTGLKAITIPDSVTKIETMAFSGCSGMTTVTLSKNLTSIDSNAFKECSGLKSLAIPNSVTTIGESAFRKCSGLKTLTLSENLTKIADRSFEGCSGLTSVILPDSVTTIEGNYAYMYGAFGDCSNLAKILIPDSVASIGVGAFQGCDKLTIYGNDGMTSKEYAETNEIPFEYIKNWDKENSGADITAPTVEKIQVTYESVMNYNKDANKNMYMVPAGAKLVINVNFSEVIEGTTVPTLTIKFGDGQNIKVTEGTVGGSTITYIYTVKNTDKGVMTTVDLSGGNIKDAAGNAATLSCPAVSIQYNSDDFVYANGTASNPEDGSGAGTGAGTGTGTGTGTGSGTGTGTGTGSGEGAGSTGGDKTVSVETVSLNTTKLNLEKGKNYTLIATVKPTDATNKSVTYKSSNESVVKVNEKGVITAVGKGTATITVTTVDGQKTAKCEVTVTEVPAKTDGTEATGKIPHAGLNTGIIVAMISVIIACVVVYSKYNKMRDI